MNNVMANQGLIWLIGGIFSLLTMATVVGQILKYTNKKESAQPTLANLNARIKAWWVMAVIFVFAVTIAPFGGIFLFGLVSFWALREFITLTPTSSGDHRTLFWAFFVITPYQYYLVAIKWYGLFTIMIPVYAFLLVPIRNALAGDCERFLERTAKIHWALMVCVYCVSHAPALLTLDIPGYAGRNANLLLFLVIVTELSDILQYVFGKTLGKHKIAPSVSPNKTWEGFVGGIAATTAIGASLWWATPFSPWQAAGMALSITLLGFAGGLTMSAIKRDRGVKDYGTMIEGHGGVMDRIDSLCFAAPVFFHLTRYYFTP